MNNVLVICGDPISPVYDTALKFADKGFKLSWSDQDTDLWDAEKKLKKGCNPALLNLHDDWLTIHDTDWLDPDLPSRLPKLHPSPEQYIGNFGTAAHVLVADPRATLFLKDWARILNSVILEITDTEWQIQQIATFANLPYWEAKLVCSKYRARIKDWYFNRGPSLGIETHISGNVKELQWM